MAKKYFTQWDDSEIGFAITSTPGDDPVLGWTKRFDAGSSPANYLRYAVNASFPPIKRRTLRTTQTAAGRGVLSWDLLDGDPARADGEWIALYISTSAKETGAYIVARGSTGATTAYYAGLSPSLDQIRITKVVAGVVTDLASASLTIGAGTSWFIRFRLQGTALSLRVWEVGTAEPSTWTLTATDGAITAAGFIGTWNEGSSKFGSWNFFAGCTGSGTAVRPITDDEFDAWCVAQDEIRCVLAEMNAVGFSVASVDYTKDVPFYHSDVDYTSHEQDTPSSRAYTQSIDTVPSVVQEMGIALKGRATNGSAALILTNPQRELGEGGIRDNYYRMKWRKSPTATLMIGAPSWPRHDFRPLFVGRVKPPTAQDQEHITFQFGEIAEAFSEPLQSNVFATGAGLNYADEFLPLLIGRAKYVEPPMYDSTNFKFKLHDGAVVDPLPLWTPAVGALALDEGLSLSSAAGHVISSVNTATEVITFTADTGASINSVCVFDASGPPPPAPLVVSTKYYVRSVPTSASITLSLTRGGAIINLTSALASAVAYFHDFDIDGATGMIQTRILPTGRLLVASVQQDGTNTEHIPSMIDWIVFTKHGLERRFRDEWSLSQLDAAMSDDAYDAGLVVDRKGSSVEGALAKVTDGSNTWYSFAPDGPLQVGRFELPNSFNVQMYFTEKDVAVGSLHQTAALAPIDFAQTRVRYRPVWLTGGPLLIDGVELDSLLMPVYDYGVVSTPIDSAPQGDTEPKSEYVTLFESGALEQPRLATMFARNLGYFTFSTHLGAMRLKIGDTISLTHARKGWKLYSVDDPTGPDNPAPFEARLAVVVRKEINAKARSPLQRVTLTVFRQMPQYAPESVDGMPPFSALYDAMLGTIGTATFTRATVAWDFDNEGLVHQLKSGEAPFTGFRREENLAPSSADFSIAGWTKTNVSVAGDKVTLTATAGNGEVTAALTIAAPLGTGDYRPRFKITRVSGTGNIQIRMGAVYTTVAVGSSPVSFTAPIASTAPGTLTWGLRIVTNGDSIKVEYAGLHDVSGRANQNPPEEISVLVLSPPYHGVNVDGVKVFTRANGCSVSSNVISDAEGSAISRSVLKGLHREPYAITNRLTAPRDLSNAAWTKTNATAASATGMDGRLNSASTLTSTLAGGRVDQTIASVPGAETSVFVLYLKRVAGSGTVSLRNDSGAGVTPITLPNDGAWHPFELSHAYGGGVARTVGIILSSNANTVAVDFGCERTKGTATNPEMNTPIDTAVAATRNVAVMSFALASIDKAQGLLFAEFAPDQAAGSTIPMYPVATETPNAVRIDADATVAGYLNGAVAASAAVTWADKQMVKAVFRWDSTRSDVWINGVRGPAGAGSALTGDSTTIYIGQNAAGAGGGMYVSRIGVMRSPPQNDDQPKDLST